MVNENVSSVIEKALDMNRGPYLNVTVAQRYQVGRRATEFGVTNTLWYYARNFPVFHSRKPFNGLKLVSVWSKG